MKNYKTLARLFHADPSTSSFAHLKERTLARLEADSTFRTGIQTSLGEFFVANPRELILLSEKVLLTEKTVTQLWDSVSGVIQWNYIRHAISEELFTSNEIEGVRSTRKETQEAVNKAMEEYRTSDGRSARFLEFAKLYLNLAHGNTTLPSTLAEIRNIYDNIVVNEIDESDKPDGTLFRASAMEIQGAHGEAIHSGVQGENAINLMLMHMMDLTQNPQFPSLQSAIVSHFLFEYTHPFYDGNGRTGRYLLALYLKQSLSLPTVLSLSHIIATRKNAYYKAFTIAEDPLNRGELTFFVETILQFISEAQEEIIEQLSIKVAQLHKAETLCNQLTQEKSLSKHASNLLFMTVQEALFDSAASVSLEAAADYLQVTKQSARKYVQELDSAGLIVFVSKRPLRFRASEQYLNPLNGTF